jgi:hypothetical protein
MGEARVLAGAAGWDHPGWVGPFYPDALPPEWRLAYYAHYFGCVLVPAAAWREAGGAGAASWVADTPAGFRFLLEAGAGAEAVATVLGERCAGVLTPGGVVEGVPPTEVIWLDAVADLRQLARRLREGRTGAALVLLIERGAEFERLARAATLLSVMGLAPDPGLV